MRKRRKKKSTKGNVVKQNNEFKDIDDDEAWSQVPRKSNKGWGIYALYNRYGLYYVGKTDSSLARRLSRHTRDRHAGKWDKFSWYQVKRKEHAKDIESIVLNIVNPAGNQIRGKFTRKKSRRK